MPLPNGGLRLPRATRAPLTPAFAAALCLLLAGLAAWPGFGASAAGSVFTVNSTADTADAGAADGLCDDGSGKCTLRAAIQQANATPGLDTVNFQIGTGVRTIELGSTLPDVTDPLVIDGSTQPGYAGAPLVEVVSQQNVLVSWGLRITAGNSTVRALSVGRASVTGIALGTAGGGGGGGNKVEACYVGLRADGATPAPVGGGCVGIVDSADNAVGGTTAAARNVLSGCGSGVEITGTASTGNVVSGNYIGTNAAGAAAAGNQTGVTIRNGASNNTVGGTAAGAGNLISGNTARGISCFSATAQTSGNKIQGNVIGLAADGQTRLGNGGDGVEIDDATAYLVGGTAPGARNVISSNVGHGVRINQGSGHAVQGNYIGTNAAGTAGVSNGGSGVHVLSSNNTIGGATAAARNVISGNQTDGVEIIGGSSNVVQGNFIGTNAAGTAALANVSDGLSDRGQGTLVGGLTPTPGAPPGNLISGQATNVTVLFGATGTVIRGNLIGTNADGTAKLVDGSFGILATAPTTLLVGGAEPGARNVISGHRVGFFGVATLKGNYIGTDVTGTQAIGNTDAGVEAQSGSLVGGSFPGEGNVISGNGTGIRIVSAQVVVLGNFIGTDATGAAPLPNAGAGVFIRGTSSPGSVVGGVTSGAGNVIAFNGGEGVAVTPGGSFLNSYAVNNSIRGNSIHSNGALGIDLAAPAAAAGNNLFITRDGVTPNDAGDADAGPNGLQNTPVVLSVSTNSGTTTAQGTLDSRPNASFVIDLYANAQCDASGAGEGRAHVSSVNVTTDAAGHAAFTATFTASPAGDVITATATDAAGNTSEFSACNVAGASSGFQFGAAAYEAREFGEPAVTVVVTRTLGGAGGGAATVDYATSNGTATAGSDYESASGTLSFAAGETTKTFTVKVLDDVLDEEEETVNLTLSNATGGPGVGAPAVLRIVDNDAPPQLQSAPNPTVAEGDSGTTPMTFGFRLNAPSGRVVTAQYRTLDDDATAPEDYQPTSGTLVFNPGETFKEVVVLVNGDTAPEPSEGLLLQIFQVVNATLPDAGRTSFNSLGVIWDDDSPGIHFSSLSYAVQETDGSASIKVVRRGDTSAPASAFYGTQAYPYDNFGAPNHRRDYTYTSGRLDFAPGETEKSFTVLVNDDAYAENPEVLVLFLSGVPEFEDFELAYLTIGSDDPNPPPATNPLGNTAFFVRQHYHDFLSREPDAAGLQFWVNDIEQCGADAQCREVHRISVSQAFFFSIEFQQTGYRVFRFYTASFPDSQERPRGMPYFLEFLRDTQEVGRGVVVGQDDWELRLRQNVEDFARRWVARAEFAEQFPAALTPEQFVDKLFANSGVTPSAQERADALAAYAQGGAAGRAAALLSATNAASVFNRQYNPAFVYMQYAGYLRRAPNEEPDFDLAGFDFWLAKLDSFTQPGEDARDETVAVRRVQRAEMVKAFITSLEFRQRFGAH